MKEIVLTLACALAAAATLPGAALADDATLVGTVTTWSVKVTGPAKALQNINANTSTTEALKASNRLATVATRATNAIARQTPSTANGRRLKVLAGSAFANFARAGKLLASAIRDVQAGRSEATVTAKVNKAVRLAKEGGTLLTRASTIIPKLL